MVSATNHQSSSLVKVLWVGNSGTGKTGALLPLVQAGYKLYVLDYDNGLDYLLNRVRTECPDRLSAIDYEPLRDLYTSSPMGIIVKGAPKAFVAGVKLLDKWSDDSTPSEWGPKSVLVIDSLTNMGKAAFNWAKAMNASYKDQKLWYSAAQNALEDVIALVTAEAFNANVIIISHIQSQDQADGSTKSFATSIGKALGPKLPRFFNNMILTESKGAGASLKRTIQTVPTIAIDLKNSAPAKVQPSYPIETGILDIFNSLRG